MEGYFLYPLEHVQQGPYKLSLLYLGWGLRCPPPAVIPVAGTLSLAGCEGSCLVEGAEFSVSVGTCFCCISLHAGLLCFSYEVKEGNLR